MILPEEFRMEGWHLVLTHRGYDGATAYRYLPDDPDIVATPIVAFVDADGQMDEVVSLISAFKRLDEMEPVNS